MKKHIFGLAIFSFIVGSAAIVYSFFNVPEIVPVPAVITVSESQPVLMRKTSCKARVIKKTGGVEIKQAVFNLHTGQFSWELATPDVDAQVALHFYSKDENGTRYIMTERVNNKFSHNGILRYSSSYGWLIKRKSHENLYVIAEFEPESENYNFSTSQPKFDALKATAVTIDYGK
jgi:hypothetical protein